MRSDTCVQDMWALLPMISLLIRATDGSLQIHHDSTIAPDTQRSTNESSNAITDNRTAEPAIAGPKIWKREAFEDKRGSKEAIDSRYIASDADLDEYEERGTDSNVRSVPEGTEAAESRFSLPPKLEVSTNEASIGKHDERLNVIPKFLTEFNKRPTVNELTIVPREFPKISQERMQPWLYWWGSKRLSLYSPSISNIRRPIRVPFNSWGGKRGYAYSLPNAGTQIKRTKLAFDRNDRDACIDGLNEIKRVAEISKFGCKTPFDSWGGKRAEKKSVEREQLLLSSDATDAFDAAKRGSANAERNIHDARERKHASRGRNAVSGMRDGLNGKWNYFLRAILPWVCNKTRRVCYTSEEENSNANDWMHNYRVEQRGPGDNGKRAFDPWGGKRSLRVYTVGFGNDYSPMPTHFAKHENAFVPLDGYE